MGRQRRQATLGEDWGQSPGLTPASWRVSSVTASGVLQGGLASLPCKPLATCAEPVWGPPFRSLFGWTS